MKQKIVKFIILFVIIAVSMFVGYKLTQNETELVGFSKKSMENFRKVLFLYS